MDLGLTEEQRKWQMKAREFAREEIAAITLARDAIADPVATFDWEIIRKGSRLGFRTAATPKEYGGHGIDLVTQALVMAELAQADSAISKTFSQNWKWSQLIAAVCTEDQKDRFLRPFVADDTYLLGSGSTEPNAGSDNRLPPEGDLKAGAQLRAERRGDEWILNGEKVFIANGSVAKLFFVRARTDPSVPVRRGTTLFLVPRETPGFRHGKVFNKRGWRFYQNAELVFENARVPHANLVGEENKGASARGADRSEFGDLELAANALGVCDAAVEMGMRSAGTRSAGGIRVVDHQLAQLNLSEMRMLTEALRSFVLRTAWERDRAVALDEGARHFPPALFVTNFSKSVIQRVTALNMEIHGGGDGTMSAGAEKLVRDAMIWTHLAGDSVVRMKAIRHYID